MSATLAIVESSWWGLAESLLLEEGAHLQVGLDGLDQAESEVWVLAVAERASTTFRGIVGGFPGRVLQVCTQADEMVVIQVLLLSTQRRQPARVGICLPCAVAPFGFVWSSPLAQVVLPDGEPGLEERAGHTQVMPDRTR